MKRVRQYKNFIENQISRPAFKNEEDFITELIKTLVELTQWKEGAENQIKFYKNVLKYILFKKFGDKPLMVNNLKEVYQTLYPFNPNKSELGFSQYEVVLDKSNKKHQIGIVLMVYSDYGNSEVRMDTNGNMEDYMLGKLSLDNFMKRLDFTREYYIKLLKAILF